MEIRYDIPIEVSAKEYPVLMNVFKEIIAGRQDKNGKYYIKIWIMRYKKDLEQFIKNLRK